MEPDLITKLDALSEKATQGPWAWDQRGEKINEWALGTAFNVNEMPLVGRFTDEDAIYDEYVCSHEAATVNYKNPEFICALVNAWRGELRERLVAAEKNAARYLWLRENQERACIWGDPSSDFDDWLLQGEELDAAIDAAMKGKQ